LKEKAQAKLGERLAVNTVFQGSAADLIKKAMRSIHEELHGAKGWKARMVLQIHDELLFEAPEKEVLDLTNMVRAKMEKAHPLHVPLVVDTGVGADWLSAKD
jgi:DNA polymerase-1